MKQKILLAYFIIVAVSISCGAPVVKKVKNQLEMPALMWGATKRPDGSTRYWDPKPLIDLGATMVSVYYRPLNDKGERSTTVGMIPPKQLAGVLKYARPELEECRKNGIRVIGYADCIMFHPSMLEAEDIDCDKLYALDSKGNRVSNGMWDKEGVFVSCVNNPNWLKLQTEVAVETAKAGFGGLMFDAYPYAIGPGYMCHCPYCKTGWEKFSKKEFGKVVPMPDSEKLDFTKREDRTFYEWRQQSYVDYVKAIETAVIKVDPDFSLVMNHWADCTDFMYQAIHGGLTHPSTEVGHLKMGEESSLYMYRTVESVCSGGLITVINSPDQIKPKYRCEVALAEAYAGGGMVYALPPAGDQDEIGQTAKRFYKFVRDNREWYSGMRSDADVAILYSWRDNAFIQETSHDQTAVNGQGKGYYRDVASLVARLGVPYDCLAFDRGLSYYRLSKYRVVIAPNLSLLDDNDAGELQKYVRQGGRLLVMGDLGTIKEVKGKYVPRSKSIPAAWFGSRQDKPWHESLGLGLVGYAPKRVPNRLYDADFDEIGDVIGLTSNVMVNCPSGAEGTIRSNGNRKAVHLIRLGSQDSGTLQPINVNYTLPKGYSIKSIRFISPDGDVKADWKVASGELRAKIESPYSYILMGVELFQVK